MSEKYDKQRYNEVVKDLGLPLIRETENNINKAIKNLEAAKEAFSKQDYYDGKEKVYTATFVLKLATNELEKIEKLL